MTNKFISLQVRIQQLLLAGNRQSDIFQQLQQDLHDFDNHYKQIPAETVKRIFNRESKISFEDYPVKFYPLVELIKAEYKKFKFSLHDRICLNDSMCNFKFLSCRYALEVHRDADDKEKVSAYLYDLLHERRKRLHINTDSSSGAITYSHCRLLLLPNSEDFLVFHTTYSDTSGYGTTIQLTRLDIAEMSCKVLDTVQSKGRHFPLGTIANTLNQFRGCVVDSKIKVEEKSLKLVHTGESPDSRAPSETFLACRIEGNKLYGIKTQDHDESTDADLPENRPKLVSKFNYYEATFRHDQITCLRVFEFVPDKPYDFGHNWYDSFLWVQNVCYISAKKFGVPNNTVFIYKFDLDTRTITKIDWSAINGKPGDLRYKDGVLSISMLNDKTMQHMWERIPLSQPDTLTQLTMKFLRQKLAFMERKNYYEFVKSLPPKLRPFEQ
ncbi:hypothetical protein M3Y97_01145000 [Aphelenchoides bicaudatus]|nr:hypothetical protein M3Y97_01145000 [Aphelenchoides bicaudatus]